MPEFTQTIGNQPNLLLIVLYGCGFLIAVVWNLYAYYKLFPAVNFSELTQRLHLVARKGTRSRSIAR